MIKRLTIASVVMLFAFGAIAQVPVPYITGFEASDGFIAGQTINGVDGWAVVSEGTPDAKVTNAVAQSGTLSVALEANCTIDKKLTAVGKTKVWMEGYFRGSGTTAAPSFPATPAASAIVFFSATDGIMCLNGNKSGGVTSWEKANVALDPAQWYKITILQDYSAKTWRCWVNDVAAPDMDLGFRDSIDSLSGFRNYADTESWLDTFCVIPAAMGDSNADGRVDVSDVVTIVNDPDGTAFGVIQFKNTDVDDNASIDGDDLNGVVAIILSRP
ncbi:MAG TPA: hypothetical protein PLB62_09455 [Candidatus Sumerlaeota bacterium]|nr:hypothetical protein [Candidatus Sumerlaeota bacterium]